MPDTTQPPTFLITIEVGAWLAGFVLLCRLLMGRLPACGRPLARWPVSIEGFVACALLVGAGGLLFPHLVTYLSHDILGPAATDGNWWLIVQGAAFQVGMLTGVALAWLLISRRHRSAEETPPALRAPTRPVIAGISTFLIALPVIGGVGFLWKIIIEFFGYAAGEQDMVDLLRNADDPVLLIWMIFLAAILAPVTEELIFRAGLFRYLRTRIPRILALMLPALLFAMLHGNLAAFLPLCTLGVIFACAYERTGSIAVPMIAHALFNLHTIVLVMAGVTG